MPHPEHNVDPLVSPTTDGRPLFASILSFLSARV
jgi:phosphoribosylformylglycinamidine synthase